MVMSSIGPRRDGDPDEAKQSGGIEMEGHQRQQPTAHQGWPPARDHRCTPTGGSLRSSPATGLARPLS